MNFSKNGHYIRAALKLKLAQNYAKVVTFLSGYIFINAQAAAQSNESAGSQFPSFFVILILIAIIAYLLKGHYKQRTAQQLLNISHKELEQRVKERTLTLRTINDQLHKEISNHQDTEVLLRQTQNFLQSMIDAMPSAVIGVNTQGIISHWNQNAADQIGKPEKAALGKPVSEVLNHIEEIDQYVTIAVQNGVATNIDHYKTGIGSLAKYFSLAVYPLQKKQHGAVIRIDDITSRVKLENMMIQSEKMVSLGELAAGMAHEINNPLSAILQGTQNLNRRLSTELNANKKAAEALNLDMKSIHQYFIDRDLNKITQSISNAGQRASKIVSNLLEFSRTNNKLQKNNVILKDLFQQSIELTSNQLKTQQEQPVDVKLHIDVNTPQFYCSASELQQVLINLMTNACQAFTHANQDPTIQIQVSDHQQGILISIKDNGPGINSTVQQHLFEPFFTTKDVGKGTGLGLSVSYFIITEHHKGTIEVESNEGLGAEFRIYLPSVKEDDSNNG